MGVFLRWGVFGILAVAALLYAYNASKSLAEKRGPKPAPVVSQEDSTADEEEEAEPEASAESVIEDEEEASETCEEEILAAERALKFRRDGEPIDRLLRSQLIAFQSDETRRARLEAVATQWFEREGRDPNAAALRREVLRDCRKISPAPEASPAAPAQ